jgi:hypothetical protein
MEMSRRFCPSCAHYVRAERDSSSPVGKLIEFFIHFWLTVASVGLWIPVALVMASRARRKPWLCPSCGDTTLETEPYELEGGLDPDPPPSPSPRPLSRRTRVEPKF